MIDAARLACLKAHIEAERRQDIDTLMDTLSAVPRYMLPGFVAEGREAVRAMYERSRWALTPDNADEYLRALDDPRVARWGEDHLVLEYTDDYPIHRGMVVVVHFESDRIRSENTYFAYGAPASPSSGSDDFASVPGVRRLG